ncbi:hypothetical protein BDP27DRAFT_1485461 [Rhodocollybia butyracea]|uniref:Cellobiose dehydrogenase cytochrome domain-containing protein n=1 Tax=Rhodocollybia butyracea TaxID=206335 RepID=A0A9P5PER6_9AGAR|nr:hypothetical protein BDP27DRAFT_1485461 [Rhodocollybia butyracea]
MLFVQSLLLSLPFVAMVLASDLSADGTNSVVPISGNNMAAAQVTTGDTRIYYQGSNNDTINQIAVSNAFTIGHFESVGVIVPADEVRFNTPIAVAAPAQDSFLVLHIFFFSPDNVLSEYHWEPTANAFEGGPTCTTCVTNEGFVGVAGSQMLYAMVNTATTPAVLRVGFVSAGSPGTISEAVKTGGSWSLASLTT